MEKHFIKQLLNTVSDNQQVKDQFLIKTKLLKKSFFRMKIKMK
jgi:hypothetical protein